MHLFKTSAGAVLLNNDQYSLLSEVWDEIINRDKLYHYLRQSESGQPINNSEAGKLLQSELLPPIGSQEVWAAGVTYLRSRDARMDESKDSGAADCYQRVYEAERPELFFKSFPHRVAGHEQEVYIRKDSTWNVPEPELALFINSKGTIQAYTIGNDMSSRSIEGENPLYLPQAKVYERSAALGPCLYIPEQPIAIDTNIRLTITRNSKTMYEGSTRLSNMKRSLPELVQYLCREYYFPTGSFLMTGTSLVPPNDFTLQKGDVVVIEIDGIGILKNHVGVFNP